MIKVTVITDNGNTESVETTHAKLTDDTGTQKKLLFSLKPKMPSSLRAHPGKAAARWDLVVTDIDGTVYSGSITAVSDRRVYFDVAYSVYPTPWDS